MPAPRLDSSAPVRAFVADAGVLEHDAAALARALDWLSPAERARFDRFRHDADRRMFVMGRLMARSLVGRELGVDPRGWEWRDGPHGRPEIAAPPTGVRFNLSHSAGCVICAIARGREVGVDVEDLERRPPDPAIVPRYCSPEEVRDVQAQGADWCRRFLTYWTLKESYLKALGLGIGVPLSDISFDLHGPSPRIRLERSLAGGDANWAFHLWRPGPRYLASVAVHAPDGLSPPVAIEAFR